MKKLLALLLSMVMAVSLVVPAFAAKAPDAALEDAVPISDIVDGNLGVIGGADGPTGIITGIEFPTADAYLAAHPGLEEQLRANAYDYFDQEYGEYWTAEEYMEYWEMTGEEFLDDMVQDQLYALIQEEAEQQQLDAMKEALGGVAGQIGVLVNGRYIPFPDAVPEITNDRTMVPVRALVEALGGEVEYQDGKVICKTDRVRLTFAVGSAEVLVEYPGGELPGDGQIFPLDSAPYLKNDRTYVPARFISEALGYEVGWDGDFQTAVLLDRDALAAEIDRDFTILNKVQASRGPAIGEGQSSLTDAKCSLTATVFDTLNGNKTYTADLSGKTLMNAQAINGSYTITVSDNAVDALAELMVGAGAGEEDAAILRSVIAGMRELEVIVTDEGKVWAHAPILDEVSGQENVWAAMDLGPELGELFALQMDASGLTMGSVIAGMMDTGSVLSCSMVKETAGMMADIYGDDKFTTADGVSTATFGLDELIALYEDMGIDMDELKNAFKTYEITMKVDEKGGVTVSCVMEPAAQDFIPAMKLTMDAVQSAGKAELAMTVHVANVCEVKLTAASSESASNDTPKTEPPEGAVVIDTDTPTPLPEYEGSGSAQ